MFTQVIKLMERRKIKFAHYINIDFAEQKHCLHKI